MSGSALDEGVFSVIKLHTHPKGDIRGKKQTKVFGPVAHLVGVSFSTPTRCRFDSWSEHITRLQVRVCMGDNQSMSVSLHHSLSKNSTNKMAPSLKKQKKIKSFPKVMEPGL